MRKSRVVVLPVLLAVAGGGIAHASTNATGDVLTASSTVGRGGTAKKPKTVAPSYSFDVKGPTGQRANPATELDQTWDGLKENSSRFPVCTAAQIDAAQSDSVCPKGSAIGQGKLTAILGTETDKTQQLTCDTTVTYYNEGNHRYNVFAHLIDNPSACLGLTYLAPTPGTFKRSGNAVTVALKIPENVLHPLPGLEGYFQHVEVRFTEATVKKGKRTYGYWQSTGCGKAKTRKFTYTYRSPGYAKPLVATSSAGKC